MHRGPSPAFLLFALILLTQLDGNAVWIETTHLSIIKTHCQNKPGSVIAIGGRELCVRETADQIREAIKNADRH
jgi:uncharacterized protein YlzI (FlbEa/FlbD family)